MQKLCCRHSYGVGARLGTDVVDVDCRGDEELPAVKTRGGAGEGVQVVDARRISEASYGVRSRRRQRNTRGDAAGIVPRYFFFSALLLRLIPTRALVCKTGCP
jgi:hypothetical protein